MSVITEVKDELRGWRLGRVVTVVDRGFSSDENLRYLTRAGGHWIAGERMRDGSPNAQAALSRQGPTRPSVTTCASRRSVVGDGDAAKRFVICHNPAEAERERTQRDETIRRLETELERIETQRRRAKSARAAEAHTPRRVRLTRPPRARTLPAPDALRAAADRPRQDRGRGQARRHVPALHLRPRRVRRGRRTRLQEPARSRTRLP